MFAVEINLKKYNGPEQFFCPAKVILYNLYKKRFMNILMMKMEIRNYKLIHKIVYIVKLVILKIQLKILIIIFL
jgi:hypothetical protein